MSFFPSNSPPPSPDQFADLLFNAEANLVASDGKDANALSLLVSYRDRTLAGEYAALPLNDVIESIAGRYHHGDDQQRLIAIRTVWSAALLDVKESSKRSMELYVEALSDPAFPVREQVAFALFVAVQGLRPGSARDTVLAARDLIFDPLMEIVRFESEVVGVIEEGGAADFACGVLRALTPLDIELFQGKGRRITLL